MSEVIACGAPPRQFKQGGREWIETCAQRARLWDVSKNGYTSQMLRCDEHAAALRRNGYEVKIVQEAPKSKERRGWDMTSLHSLEAAANWFCAQSGAVVVLVVRAGDAVFAVDAGVSDKDIPGLLHAALPGAYAQLEQFHAAQREKQVRQQIRSGVNPEEAAYVSE